MDYYGSLSDIIKVISRLDTQILVNLRELLEDKSYKNRLVDTRKSHYSKEIHEKVLDFFIIIAEEAKVFFPHKNFFYIFQEIILRRWQGDVFMC